jgi:hypothetical protein
MARRRYKKSTRALVAAAFRFAEEKRAKGWTREDAAASLKRMLSR